MKDGSGAFIDKDAPAAQDICLSHSLRSNPLCEDSADRGLFITFEGIDGCGKSTQAKDLAAWLKDEGHDVLLTFEPGGWPEDGITGKRLRELILNGDIRDTRAEFLLFLADRSAHSARVIEPALKSGKTVICERWSDSTIAYQCGGRGFSRDDAEAVLSACRFREPDLTILLDISPEEAASRLKKRGQFDGIESAGLDFMRRTADSYLSIAKRCPDRVTMVPSFISRQETAERIRRTVILRMDGINQAQRDTGKPAQRDAGKPAQPDGGLS